VAQVENLQISKLSMIPVVCLMEWVLNSKHYTTKVISAVIVVAAGVGICTVTDVEVNAKGFICACVAVFCTSLQQIVSSFPFFSPVFLLAFLYRVSHYDMEDSNFDVHNAILQFAATRFCHVVMNLSCQPYLIKPIRPTMMKCFGND
jgi:hypothetical protein